jgi:hypothetical protein
VGNVRHARLLVTLTFLAALAACKSGPAPLQPDPEVGGGTTDDPAIVCMRDQDCAALACGPCEAGTPIKESMRARTCVTNPCKNAAAYCTPERVCAVK